MPGLERRPSQGAFGAPNFTSPNQACPPKQVVEAPREDPESANVWVDLGVNGGRREETALHNRARARRRPSQIHGVASVLPVCQRNLVANLLHYGVGPLPAALSMPQKSLHENRATRIQVDHTRTFVFGQRLICIPIPNDLLRAIPVHLRLVQLSDLARHLSRILRREAALAGVQSLPIKLLKRMNTAVSNKLCQGNNYLKGGAIADLFIK